MNAFVSEITYSTESYFETEFMPEKVIDSGGGTKDYERLYNKPQINGVELVGNKIDSELGIEAVEVAELAAHLL